MNRRLAETRSSIKEELTADAVLDGARREAAEARRVAKKVLPASMEARRETLGRLQRMLAEPAKSEEDLYALQAAAAGLEDHVSRLTLEVAALQRAAGDDKAAMFRQQAAIVAKKLSAKEEAVEVATRESDALGREVEAKVWGHFVCIPP